MDSLNMHTPDFSADNIARLAELFPQCVTESRDAQGRLKKAIDFDLLRQELSDHIVDGPQERYQLNWPGKREALLTANAPIAKTLRPARAESVDFDTTQNLFIEGDNLDALKLLQETYLGKVKLIYIDPPYNTTNDLVYRDDFRTSREEYLISTNQIDAESNRLLANPESNGRRHSLWLSMIYSRIKLARNLLQDDGVILISIDDNEYANLKKLADEIFGYSNAIATLIWEKGRKNDAKLFSVGHEYILVYAKSLESLRVNRTVWREEKPGAKEIWEKYLELRKRFGEDFLKIEKDLQDWFSSLPKDHPSKKWSRYKRVDKNGPWRDRDISWPGGGGPRYDVIHPVTKRPCRVPESGWRYADKGVMERQIQLGLVVFREDHTEPPFRKAHIKPVSDELEDEVGLDSGRDEELATQVRGSYFYKQSQVSVKVLRELLGVKAFNNPKDHFELAKLITYVGGPDDTILDFFAGSGSTGHAVMEANKIDGGNRRFILVQYPEELDHNNKEQAVAVEFCKSINTPPTIAEISKERIRRAGKKILEGPCHEGWRKDVGFRVLKVDSSNMADVFYRPELLTQDLLSSLTDNIKPDRSAEDLLFQVLLDWGVDLRLPIQEEEVLGKRVFRVDTDALLACFETGIDEALIKALAAYKPLRAVFRDSGFANDATKINAEQIFRQLSPSTDVKVL